MTIELATPVANDHRLLVKWRNQDLVSFFSSSPLTLESHLQWYEQVVTDATQHFYVIVRTQPNGTFDCIGSIGLKDSNLIHRRAEYGRFLIAPFYRGEGYGRLALLSLLDIAFGTLDLNRVYGYILASSRRGLTVALSAGFLIEGTFHQHVYKDDKYFDVISVGITVDTWRGL